MFIRLRIRAKIARARRDYPIRVSSLLASAGIHCIVVVLLASISSADKRTKRPVYDELVRPQLHKIIYYDFHKKLPDVNPNKVNNPSPPRGTEVSRQTIIAKSPNATSNQQFVMLSAPKVELHRDVQMPNVIARMNLSLPSAPDIPKSMPKPPVEAPKAARPNNSPAEPKGDLNHAPESTVTAAQVPKQPKVFVPQRQATEPRLPLPAPLIDAPTPTSASASESRLPAGAAMPALSLNSIPTATAPVAPVASAGNARVDVAVASLHPEDANKVVPDGNRAGKFSKAPLKGDEPGGANGKPMLTVPNLTIREESAAPEKPPAPVPVKTTLYAERIRSVSSSTLSVPLRPASRSIPRALDARFQGRSVYTIVIPIENLPAYSGDWILWFAEIAPKPGDSPLMRAPLPYRKVEPVDDSPVTSRTGARVQLAAILDKSGKLGQISLITRMGPAMERAVTKDVTAWEFKPATRNGVPVDVDVVIEITFNLPPSVAERSQP